MANYKISAIDWKNNLYYKAVKFCEYTKKEAIRKFRQDHDLTNKRVEIIVERIGPII